ncbi:hypothetical protein ACXWP2_09515, partial [Streptococcus pyogenes]
GTCCGVEEEAGGGGGQLTPRALEERNTTTINALKQGPPGDSRASLVPLSFFFFVLALSVPRLNARGSPHAISHDADLLD